MHTLSPTALKLAAAIAAATTLLSPLGVHAHMVMQRPTPYSPELAATWPINAPGAGRFPYPCQGHVEVQQRTELTAGSTTILNFTGSAPHGGGSCQIGINYVTTETSPYSSNPEDFKTIYTIIGGCPAVVTTEGNLEVPPYAAGMGPNGIPDAVHCGDDTGLNCIRQFNIPIPKGLPNGEATFAMIWWNRITKEELYMNCAPVMVTGGDDVNGEQFLQGLPPMFVGNIPGFPEVSKCTTSTTGPHGVFNIPNPGDYGVVLEQPDPAAAGDCPVVPVPAFSASAEAGAAPAIDAPPAEYPASPAGTPPVAPPAEYPVPSPAVPPSMAPPAVPYQPGVPTTLVTVPAPQPTPGQPETVVPPVADGPTCGGKKRKQRKLK